MEKSRLEERIFPTYLGGAIIGLILHTIGFFVPYWFGVDEGDNSRLYGLWFAQICLSSDCDNYWYSDDDLKIPSVTSWEAIQALETLALIAGILSVAGAMAVLMTRKKSWRIKVFTQTLFFSSSIIAGFMALTGVFIFVSKGDGNQRMWASAVSAIGGAVWLITGVLSCMLCRFDPTLGRDSNPAYPAIMVENNRY